MRRIITLVFALALVVVSVPAAGATTGTLDVDVGLAPIVPDGTVAGEITDFVLTFKDHIQKAKDGDEPIGAGMRMQMEILIRELRNVKPLQAAIADFDWTGA